MRYKKQKITVTGSVPIPVLQRWFRQLYPHKCESKIDVFCLSALQTGYKNPRRICAFIEPNITDSKWSGEGCTLNEKESNEVIVTCDCNHNTAFAILMDFAGVKVSVCMKDMTLT